MTGERRARRRLSPDARQAQLLSAAREVFAEVGSAGFSLELVAARAGVTGPLLRHYFGSRDGLLLAAARAMLDDLMGVFARTADAPLEVQLRTYLEQLRREPWSHRTWMHADEIHPEVGALVARVRVRLAALSAGAEWETLPARRRLEAMGWMGLVESTVAQWIEDGLPDDAPVLEVLLDAARALRIRVS